MVGAHCGMALDTRMRPEIELNSNYIFVLAFNQGVVTIIQPIYSDGFIPKDEYG